MNDKQRRQIIASRLRPDQACGISLGCVLAFNALSKSKCCTREGEGSSISAQGTAGEAAVLVEGSGPGRLAARQRARLARTALTKPGLKVPNACTPAAAARGCWCCGC